MIKKYLCILICAAALANAAAVSGADTPLRVVYFTNMKLQSGFNDMARLTDGVYLNSPIVIPMQSSAEFDDSYMIEGFFAGNEVTLSTVEVGCWETQIGKQNITKARIDYLDTEMKEWTTAVDGYELEWNAGKSIITLPQPVAASKVRFYIQGAERIWNNFRLEELRMLGTVTGSIGNISENAAVSVNFACRDGNEKNLNDGNFLSETVSANGVLPSEGNPCTVELDFGDEIYKIEQMLLGERYGRDAGITKARVYRKIYGAWEKLKDIELEKGAVNSTDNYELAVFELNTEASGIKLEITAANARWNNFRIGEIMLFGEKTDSSVKDIAGNIKTVFPESKELPYIITMNSEYAFSPKAIKFKSSGVTGAAAGFRLEGQFILLAESYNILQGGETVLILPDALFTDALELQIVSAENENYSIEEIKLFAEDPAEKIMPMIAEFEKSGKYTDYLSAQEAANQISHDKTREKIINIIENAADKLRDKQTLTAEYDLKENKLTLGGYLFVNASEPCEAVITCGDTVIKERIAVDENGNINCVIDFSEKAVGIYEISVVSGEKIIKANFEKRELFKESGIISFAIDGADAVINGKNVNIKLPSYGSLKNRVAVFKLTQGAKMYLDEQEIISGTTAVDYTEERRFNVVAEDGSSTAYTVNAELEKKQSSGGGSGGGSRGGGTAAGAPVLEVKLPIAETYGEPKEGVRFADVPQSHWAYEYIESMAKAGVVNGYEDGGFYPEKYITREEFIKILVEVMELKETGSTDIFEDARGHWSSGYIGIAYENKLINGIDGKNFGVGYNLSREDMAVIFCRSLPENVKSADTSGEQPFDDDENISDYARQAVYTLKALGIIEGSGNKFMPAADTTRAEAVKMLAARRKI